MTPQIIAQHATLQPSQLRQRVLSDPTFAARLGNPVVETGSLASVDSGPDWALLDYPPLRNPTEIRVRLDDTREFRRVWGNGVACGLPPPDSMGRAIEFYNASLDHYFYSVDAGEIAALDSGMVRGCTRTGQSFAVIRQPGCPPFDLTAPTARGAADWMLEGVPFWAWKVDAQGRCPDPVRQVALFRLWRPFGDSNHRFTPYLAIVDEMVAKGWIDEGPAMCVAGL